MKKIKLFLILGLSLAALGGAFYLGYNYFYRQYLSEYLSAPEPAVSEEDKADKETAERDQPEESLPPELEGDLAERRDRRRELFEEAIEAHRGDDFNEALNLYGEVISLGARDLTAARAYRYLGDIYAVREEYEKALENYDFAINLADTQSIFHYRRGRVFWARDQWDSAARSFEEAIELEKVPDYFLARGNLSYELGNDSEAVQFFERGLQVEQRADLYLNLALARRRRGNLEGAKQAFKGARNRGVNSDVEYRISMNMGEIHLEQQQYSRAVDEFERARQLDRTPEVLYNLGRAEIERENFEKAIDYLNQARQLSPDDSDVLVDLGYCYEKVENYRQAIEAYSSALELKPDDSGLYLALGRLNEWVDRPQEALEYYQELVQEGQPGEELAMVNRRIGELFLQFEEP
ncbi:MAG: tetratricopeptide repeat protein, partial [bacterium]